MNKSDARWLLFVLYLIVACLSFWSYTLVDVNLILLPYQWFFSVQKWFWIWGSNRQLLAGLYLMITLIWWILWFIFQKSTTIKKWSWKNWIIALLPVLFLLLVGYNALSHDIFNYLFNAKMVTVYHVNPHEQVALNFDYDPWVRFMHNIHTPAPYGYGWTLISLIPGVLSMGKFLLTYFLMKIWMIVGLAGYLLTSWWLLNSQKIKNPNQRFALIALHPLLFIETVLIGHNDVWMMWPMLLAIGLILNRRRSWLTLLAVVGLAIFSYTIKLASILLVPVLVGLWLEPSLKQILANNAWQKAIYWLKETWAEWSALLLLAPLLTSRSQWFHPWYLIWPLTFLPFVKWRWLKAVLIGLSISSTWRYIPWMLSNLEYSALILQQMRWITWSGALFGLLFWLVKGLALSRVRKHFPKKTG